MGILQDSRYPFCQCTLPLIAADYQIGTDYPDCLVNSCKAAFFPPPRYLFSRFVLNGAESYVLTLVTEDPKFSAQSSIRGNVMSSRNRLALPLVVLAVLSLAFLVGCGSSSPKATPPPTGAFSDSDLNGTYVFSTSGTDVNGAPIMLTGAFTANGSGTISGGALSYADGSIGTGSNQTITAGSYNVTQDGRGQIHLVNSTTLGTVILDFALATSSHGVVSEYDQNGTGSGTLDLQGTIAQSGFDGQSYAFSVAGSGTTGNLLAEAGAFTLDANGAVTTGVEDITSYNTSTGTSSSQTGLGISTSSSLAIGTGTAPGAFSVSTGAGAFTFDAYAIDSTHVKLIETDGTELTSGDMLTQGTSLPSGTLAFTMSGLDLGEYPLSIGGLLPVSSGSISGGLEDYNDGGSASTSTSVSGGFAALASGRSVLTLSGIENGGTNLLTGTYSFAAYPTSTGLILLEIDNGGITMGTAVTQTNTSFAASQGYAFDLTAVNISGASSGSGFYEEDDIAEFTSTSSTFTGLADVNDEGTLTFDQRLSGTYQSASTGRYTFTADFNNGFGGATGVFYTVDGSTVLMLEGDDYQVGTGTMGVQNAAAAQGALAHAIGLVRARIPANRAAKRRN